MSEVKFGKEVTLAQAAKLIVTNPKLRFMLRGEPGIGKSSLLKEIGRQTGYDIAYIDVPNMDLGDIAMPVIDHETRTTKYYPNARFKMHEGKLDSGDRVLLVEDVATTGGQVLEAAKTITDAGATVEKIVAVIDRQEGARENIEAAGFAFESLMTKTDLGITD